MSHPFDDVMERLRAIAADPVQPTCLRYKAAIVALDLMAEIEIDAERARSELVTVEI